MAALLVGALNGVSKDILLTGRYSPWIIIGSGTRLSDRSMRWLLVPSSGSDPPEIKGSGFVVASLEAALWAFYNSNSFEEGCLLAVNLGDDADTTGAIYGQLAGAHYGVNAIPARWMEKITLSGQIKRFADQLFEFSSQV